MSSFGSGTWHVTRNNNAILRGAELFPARRRWYRCVLSFLQCNRRDLSLDVWCWRGLSPWIALSLPLLWCLTRSGNRLCRLIVEGRIQSRVADRNCCNCPRSPCPAILSVCAEKQVCGMLSVNVFSLMTISHA